MKKIIIYLFLLFFQVMLSAEQASAMQNVFSNHELIRNGDFEDDYRSWYSINCSPSPRAAKDGKFGMHMSGMGGKNKVLTFFQNIIIPSQLSSVSLSYDYRVRQWADEGQNAEFKLVIGKSKGFECTDFADIDIEMIAPIEIIHSKIFDANTEWQHIQLDLNQDILNKIQTAHQDGFFIFLQFFLIRSESERLDLDVHIDNLSLKISGQQKTPQMNGLIAYIGGDPEQGRDTINILNPNDNTTKIIWTYPDKKQMYQWKDLKWRPGSSELAFVSDFENPFSPTYTNIYAIEPDGENFRKISNPPFQNEIQNGNYPKIKVTGRIKNQSEFQGGGSSNTAVELWIQGASKTISLKLPSDGASVPFEIDDVAVLDDDSETFEPVIVLHWSNAECAYGIEYERPVSQISSSKTDIGILTFDGLVCNEGSEVNSIRNISWKWDGSEIGFAMIGGLRKIDPAGQSIFNTKELAPFSSMKWPDHLSWSPVDHHYLYYDYDLPSMQNAGLYIAIEGGDAELLISDAKSTAAAWLPDGKSFLYIRDAYEDKNIYHYNLQTKAKRRLTYFSYESIEGMSISDDGRHIVFELRNTWTTPIQSDLWIMDLINPTKIWQITRDGKSTNPDWSKTETNSQAHGAKNENKTLNSEEVRNTVENHASCFITVL